MEENRDVRQPYVYGRAQGMKKDRSVKTGRKIKLETQVASVLHKDRPHGMRAQ
jgi:hypothetical protein